MNLTRRNGKLITPALIIAALITWLVLPNVPSGRAYTRGLIKKQDKEKQNLSADRQAALEKLAARYEAGEPFSSEEAEILRRFAEGQPIRKIEADTLISRALYSAYVTGEQLSREQEVLLSRYTAFIANRKHDLLDRKAELLEERRARQSDRLSTFSVTAAPSNDTCAGAEIIPAGGPFPYLTATTADITDATITGDPPLPSCTVCSPTPCSPQLSRSIWYKFTPSLTATYTISTCADAGTATTVDDTVMGIYTSSGACAGAFTEIPTSGLSDGCGDDECGNEPFQAEIVTQLTSGTTYYIVVWLYGTPAPTVGNTAVQLSVSRAAVPANDTCASPVSLSLDAPVAGTNVGAADDYELSGAACFTGTGNTSSAASGRDVVYSFTATSADKYSFRVTGYGATSDLVVYVASLCPAATPGTPVTVSTCLAAANRNFFDSSEEAYCVQLSMGQQVFIFVDEDDASDGSNFVIEVTRCSQETEPNGTPATADSFVFGLEGSINPAGEADFYSLGTPANNSRVFALVDGAAANINDFDLRVTTTTDTLEYDDLNADSPFGSLSATVGGTPTTGTQVFLRVSQFFSTDTSEPYRLYAVVQPPIAQATAESEPNGTIATADSAANNYFTGTLSGATPSTDVDIFQFTAVAGNVIFASLDGDPLRNNTPLNARLTLLDSAGVVLMDINDSGSVSNTTSGAGTLTSTTPNSPAESLAYRATTTGTYYVKVSAGTSSAVASGAGDYLLSIAQGATSPTAVRFRDYDDSMYGQLNNSESQSMAVEAKAKMPVSNEAALTAQSIISSRAAIKLFVPQEGFYRVDLSELERAGLDSNTPAQLLQLYADGQEQPMNVVRDGAGRLAAIEFYGLGIDSPYSKARTYWLTTGPRPGKRIKQVSRKGKHTTISGFDYAVERRDRTIFFSSLNNGDKENFFGTVVTGNPVDQSVILHAIDPNSSDATLEVALQGVTDTLHQVAVEINGVKTGTLTFEGRKQSAATMRVSRSAIREGENIVRLTPLEGVTDVTFVDFIRINYSHRYTAEAGALRFTARNNQLVTVDGFATSRIRVFDVTDPGDVREVVGAVTPRQSSYGVTVGVAGKGTRSLLAVAERQVKHVAGVVAGTASSLRQPINEADFVILTRKDFFAALEPLKQLRQGQGLKTSLVDIEDVYDEFSFGQKTPQAIRDFLAYARSNWKTAPRFVLMVGDASSDAKNYLGRGDNDIVPTRMVETAFMEAASDDWFADFDSDGVPEMAVGRIPVRSSEEASLVVGKIIKYEQATAIDRMLLVTDARDGFDFEATSALLRQLAPAGAKVEELNRGSVDPATAKSQLIRAINRGQKIVNYVGHGSTDLWQGELFTTADASKLTNRDNLSIFISMTCLNGQFQDAVRESLAESLLKSAGGGAAAVWASSGMTEPRPQAMLNQAIFKVLFDKSNGSSMRLGEATLKAKSKVNDLDTRRTWILFGDPTMRLK